MNEFIKLAEMRLESLEKRFEIVAKRKAQLQREVSDLKMRIQNDDDFLNELSLKMFAEKLVLEELQKKEKEVN